MDELIQKLRRLAEQGDEGAVLKLEAALDRVEGGRSRFYVLREAGREAPLGAVRARLEFPSNRADGDPLVIPAWAFPVRTLEGLFSQIDASTWIYDSALDRLFTASRAQRAYARVTPT